MSDDETYSDIEAFGRFLKAQRGDCSQAVITNSGGPGATTLNDIENGRQWPTWPTIKKLQFAYKALERPWIGHDIAAVFRLVAPEAQFEGEPSGRPALAPGSPWFYTSDGLTLLNAVSDKGAVVGDAGLYVTKITLETDAAGYLPWETPAWAEFIDNAIDNAAFTFVEHTQTLIDLFWPGQKSHAYFQTAPRAHDTSLHRYVAIDPTWEYSSSDTARVALESLLPVEGVDPWAPLVLMSAVQVARERSQSNLKYGALAGGDGDHAAPDVHELPGPLSLLLSGNEVERKLSDALVRAAVVWTGPDTEDIRRASRQILHAYRDVIAAAVGQISIGLMGTPEFAPTAVRKYENLPDITWTGTGALPAARAISRSGHNVPSRGTRKGLTVSEWDVTVGVWEGAPDYTSPALEQVHRVVPFDDVFLGARQGRSVAFRV